MILAKWTRSLVSRSTPLKKPITHGRAVWISYLLLVLLYLVLYAVRTGLR